MWQRGDHAGRQLFAGGFRRRGDLASLRGKGGLNMAENYTLKIDAGADYFLAFRLKDGEVE